MAAAALTAVFGLTGCQGCSTDQALKPRPDRLAPDVVRLFNARAREILEKPDSITVFGLDDKVYSNYERREGEPGDVKAKAGPSHAEALRLRMERGEGIWGRTTVPVDRAGTIANQLYQMVVEPSPVPGSFMCFDPHHGLVFTRGSERVVLVICFMCSKLVVLHDGGPAPEVNELYGFDVQYDLFKELHPRLVDAGAKVPPDVAELYVRP